MKKMMLVSTLALSFSAFAHEEIELTARAQTSAHTYHTTTNCFYGPASFEIEAHELKDVTVYSRPVASDLWVTVEHAYKIVDGKTVVVVPAQKTTQSNNTKCPVIQVQLVK